MDEEWIEIADLPLLVVTGWKGMVVGIGFIEGLVEAAEEGGHGQIDTAVAVIDGWVNEYGFAHGVAEKVAIPEITMQQGRRLGGKDLREEGVEALEMPAGGRRQGGGGWCQGRLGVGTSPAGAGDPRWR